MPHPIRNRRERRLQRELDEFQKLQESLQELRVLVTRFQQEDDYICDDDVVELQGAIDFLEDALERLIPGPGLVRAQTEVDGSISVLREIIGADETSRRDPERVSDVYHLVTSVVDHLLDAGLLALRRSPDPDLDEAVALMARGMFRGAITLAEHGIRDRDTSEETREELRHSRDDFDRRLLLLTEGQTERALAGTGLPLRHTGPT